MEDIGTLSKEGLQLSEISKLTLGIEPAVSQASADEDPVLALHVAVVILVVGTGTDNAPRIEKHLASWTKGCEGPKDSGEARSRRGTMLL